MSESMTEPSTPLGPPRPRSLALWIASGLSGICAALLGLLGMVLTLATPGLPDEVLAFVAGGVLFLVSLLSGIAAALRTLKARTT